MLELCRRASVPVFVLSAVLAAPARSASLLESLRSRAAAVPEVGPAVPLAAPRRPPPPGAPAPGETFVGRVSVVSDGDTVHIRTASGEFKVRFAEIDAPEHDQPFGPEAKANLERLIMGREVTARVMAADQYGRLVCRVALDGAVVNRRLVADGWAWWYRYFSQDQSLGELESQARAARRGLWSGESPEAPWDYRRRTRALEAR